MAVLLSTLFQKFKCLPKQYVFGGFLLAACLGAFSAQTWFPIYEAQAKISLGPDGATKQQQFLSRPVLTQTQYALQNKSPKIQNISTEILREGLELKPIPDTDVVLVKFRHKDPKSAAVIANTLCITFMAHDQFSKLQLRSSQRDYYERQLAATQALLKQAETEKNQSRWRSSADKVSLLTLTQKVDALAQSYAQLLTKYKKELLSQLEPPQTVIFIESAVAPATPLHPWGIVVFFGVFSPSFLASLGLIYRYRRQAPKPAAQDVPDFAFPSRDEPSFFESRPSAVLEPQLQKSVPISVTRSEPPPTEFDLPTLSTPGKYATEIKQILESPLIQKRTFSIFIAGLEPNNEALVEFLNELLRNTVLNSKKTLIVTFSGSENFASQLSIPLPKKSALDYIRGEILPLVTQKTRIENCFWMAAEQQMGVIAKEDSLEFLTRRLKLYFDNIIYVHAVWNAEIDPKRCKGISDAWVVVQGKTRSTARFEEQLLENGFPVASRVKLEDAQ